MHLLHARLRMSLQERKILPADKRVARRKEEGRRKSKLVTLRGGTGSHSPSQTLPAEFGCGEAEGRKSAPSKDGTQAGGHLQQLQETRRILNPLRRAVF